MFEKVFWRPFGRFADMLSVVQALWGWAAFWAAAAALMTWAASTVKPILDFGWGAAIIAGVVLASMVILAISTALVAWRYFRPIVAGSLPSVRSPNPGADLGRRLYVGRVVADTQKVLSDLYLEFAVVAFNGASVKLTLDGVRGFISFGTKVPTSTADLVRLPAPTIREDNPLQFDPLGEFMVIVSQRLPGNVAADIDHLLSAGEQVEFSFEALAIELCNGEDGQKVRLPLGPSWEWAILQREKDTILLKRQIRMSASVVIGGKARPEAG